MPKRGLPDSSEKTSRPNFRRRYDELESRREQLVRRLTALGDVARRQAGYRNALKLLNDTFRKVSLGQRLAVLQAAAFLIEILEKIASGS